MKRYTENELNKILELHQLWLEDDKRGVRADLSYSDLSYSDLSNFDLRRANLSNSNLIGANLSNSNLSNSNLSNSNLSYSNLSNSDLSKADLSKADLSYSDLSGTNLSNIKNKDILIFQAGEHFAYACDGYIKIGCKQLTAEEWLREYKDIGRMEGYTDREIEAYGSFIKLVQKY